MRSREITCVSHYQPLHASEMGRRTAARETACPVAESVAERVVRLPFYFELSEDQRDRVIEAALAFFS